MARLYSLPWYQALDRIWEHLNRAVTTLQNFPALLQDQATSGKPLYGTPGGAWCTVLVYYNFFRRDRGSEKLGGHLEVEAIPVGLKVGTFCFY